METSVELESASVRPISVDGQFDRSSTCVVVSVGVVNVDVDRAVSTGRKVPHLRRAEVDIEVRTLLQFVFGDVEKEAGRSLNVPIGLCLIHGYRN